MILVGLATLVVYTGVAVIGVFAIDWFISTPPHPFVLIAVFAVVAIVGAYVGYRDGLVQVVTSLDAITLPREHAPAVYRRLDRLCERMNVRSPPLLLADLDGPNALSLGGPRRGAIVLDRQLVRMLTIDELEGILAHELAHMEQYDTFLNTFVLSVTRLFSTIIYVLFLPLVIFFAGVDRAAGWMVGDPTRFQFGLSGLFRFAIELILISLLSIFTLIFLAHSRRQEYRADSRAATVTGNPVALARALAKIHNATNPRSGLQSLLYIHDDRKQQRHYLFSTHPPLEERIERLLVRAERGAQHQYIDRLRP